MSDAAMKGLVIKIELLREDLEDLNGSCFAPLLMERGAEAIGYKMQKTGKQVDYWRVTDKGYHTWNTEDVKAVLPYIKEGYSVSIEKDLRSESIIYRECRS